MSPELPDTPWDKRVVRAMTAAETARQGAVILRVLAAVVALAGTLGPILYFTDDSLRDSGGRLRLGQILQVSALPLAGAGVVFAFSYLVELYASRLDLDIVLADDDQTGGTDDEPGTELPPPLLR